MQIDEIETNENEMTIRLKPGFKPDYEGFIILINVANPTPNITKIVICGEKTPDQLSFFMTWFVKDNGGRWVMDTPSQKFDRVWKELSELHELSKAEYKRIKQDYYAKGLNEDVEDFIKSAYNKPAKHESVIKKYAIEIHELNKRWWCNLETGEYKPEEREIIGLVNLFISEAAEMYEAIRKNTQSTKIPEFTGEAEELADLLIRIFDTIGGLRLYEDNAVEPANYSTLAEYQAYSVQQCGYMLKASTKQRDVFELFKILTHVGNFIRPPTTMYLNILDTIDIIFVYAHKHNIPLIDAVGAKLLYNKSRPDHTLEARRKQDGKKF